MEISLLQLFWVVIILVIFIASVVKRYLSNKKSKDRLSRVRVREREESKKSRPEKPQVRPEWEDFMSDMFGIEPIKVKPEKPSEKRRKPTIHKETKEKEQIDRKSAELRKPRPSEFHATIEDRHIKSKIEEDVLKSSIDEQHVISTLPESKQEYKPKIKKKRITPIAYNILKKEGLKNAIIYSEIIGPPIGMRKKSIFRHIR